MIPYPDGPENPHVGSLGGSMSIHQPDWVSRLVNISNIKLISSVRWHFFVATLFQKMRHKVRQGKSRWHSYHVLVYISPVLTYLLGTVSHVLWPWGINKVTNSETWTQKFHSQDPRGSNFSESPESFSRFFFQDWRESTLQPKGMTGGWLGRRTWIVLTPHILHGWNIYLSTFTINLFCKL